MNIRLDIEYDGAGFQGWQRQPEGQPTIQAALEDTLQKILNRRVVLYGASRTDSGVHAQSQVANFYTEPGDPNIAPVKWRVALNTALPPTIRITQAQEMPGDFHAQKDAASKLYVYRILNRDFSSALDRRVFFYPGALDWDAMAAAMPYFVGTKDFRAFQAAGSTVLTTVRSIYRFDLVREAECLYRFEIEGNGFLRQMVRNIMGTLVEVGERKRKPSEMVDIFASQDRSQAGRTLPARGLCLVCIHYPKFDRVNPRGSTHAGNANLSPVPGVSRPGHHHALVYCSDPAWA